MTDLLAALRLANNGWLDRFTSSTFVDTSGAGRRLLPDDIAVTLLAAIDEGFIDPVTLLPTDAGTAKLIELTCPSLAELTD